MPCDAARRQAGKRAGRRLTMTAADVRIPHARWIVVAAALAVCAGLLLLTRTYTFYWDEWTFITTSPDWTLASYFRPHNEHPAILFRLLYAGLLKTFGLHTYLPYMAVVLAFHLADVMLLFELVRRRAGDLVGMAAAALLLVLGAGAEDILWAFQMAWLASVGLGLGALLLLAGSRSRARLAAAAGLLLGSLMFSGVGIPFAVAAAVLLAATGERRWDVLWLAPVGVALAAWYLAFGRLGNHPDPQPTAFNLLLDPIYTAWGLGASVAALVGLKGWFGPPILAVAVFALAVTWIRRRPDPLATGVAAGLFAFFAVAGLTRAQLGYQQSASDRYLYVAGVLWLILLADAARALPIGGTWRPYLLGCAFLACTFNSALLLDTSAASRARAMERQVADYYALSAMRPDPCLDPHAAVDLKVMPAVTEPALYYRAIDIYGDPAAGRPLNDHAEYETGLGNLRRPGC
jgi:hypothetical protein